VTEGPVRCLHSRVLTAAEVPPDKENALMTNEPKKDGKKLSLAREKVRDLTVRSNLRAGLGVCSHCTDTGYRTHPPR
jgi:hypothetical protein